MLIFGSTAFGETLNEGLVYLSGWARSCGAEVPFAYLRDGMRPERELPECIPMFSVISRRRECAQFCDKGVQ